MRTATRAIGIIAGSILFALTAYAMLAGPTLLIGDSNSTLQHGISHTSR